MNTSDLHNLLLAILTLTSIVYEKNISIMRLNIIFIFNNTTLWEHLQYMELHQPLKEQFIQNWNFCHHLLIQKSFQRLSFIENKRRKSENWFLTLFHYNEFDLKPSNFKKTQKQHKSTIKVVNLTTTAYFVRCRMIIKYILDRGTNVQKFKCFWKSLMFTKAAFIWPEIQ